MRLQALQTEFTSARLPRRSTAVIAYLAWSLLVALTPVMSGLAASPPGPLRTAGTQDTSSEDKPGDDAVSTSNPIPAESLHQPGEESPTTSSADQSDLAHWSSVRARGLESPVDLKPDPKPDVEPADKLDGIRNQNDTDHKKRSPTKKKETPVSAREQRVWPLPDENFTFTQAFGCVPQLGNLYLPGVGCPPDRPVIHTGIDLAAPEGTVFYAAASGWVTLAGYDRPTPDANTRIIIQHDGRQEGYSTEYLHWVASYVAVGDYVRAGEPIGEVGNVGYSTGPHLHFSVIDLATGEHIDPVRWLPPDNKSGAYKGRLPSAQMRLPAGTTAGQPEEADLNPAPVPTKVKVPKSPPQDDADGNGGNGRHKHDRGDGNASGQASDESANSDSRSKRAKNGDTTAAEESRDGSHTKKRERNKDGMRSEHSASGKDGQRREDKSTESDDGTTDTGRDGHHRKDATDPGQGSRRDDGSAGRHGDNHDQRGGGGNGDRHDSNNRGGGDNKNDRSGTHGGNGQKKHDDARKKSEVTAESGDEQTSESAATGDNQSPGDETGANTEIDGEAQTADDADSAADAKAAEKTDHGESKQNEKDHGT